MGCGSHQKDKKRSKENRGVPISSRGANTYGEQNQKNRGTVIDYVGEEQHKWGQSTYKGPVTGISHTSARHRNTESKGRMGRIGFVEAGKRWIIQGHRCKK